MIRHCALMKFSDESTTQQREAARAAVAALPAVIPEISSMAIGPDLGMRDDNYDMAVIVDFADVDGYQAYATNPDHVSVIQKHLAPIMASRAGVQFEV